MNDWIEICRVDDIPVLGARRVRRPAGTDVAIFRTGSERVFALLDRCPHKGGPLSQGIVFGEHVACPLHNWAISLEDGQARAPDIGCATRFAVRVEGGAVSLLAGELAALAVDEAALAGVDPATSRRMTAALPADLPAASPSLPSCTTPSLPSCTTPSLPSCTTPPLPSCETPTLQSSATPLSSCAKSQDPRVATIPIVSV